MALDHMICFCPKCKIRFSVFEPMKLEDDVQYFQMLITYLHDEHFGHGYWFGFDEDNYGIYKDGEWKEWRYGTKALDIIDEMTKKYRRMTEEWEN